MTLNKKSVSMTLILSVAMELHRLQEQERVLGEVNEEENRAILKFRQAE
ncbi:MAG: hypothetical protein IJI11_03630 [Mogibacterium sp.]|nr:hypothetical protein [Mogibacterium sp.]